MGFHNHLHLPGRRPVVVAWCSAPKAFPSQTPVRLLKWASSNLASQTPSRLKFKFEVLERCQA